MIVSKELRKSLGNFFIGIASFVTTVFIARPMLLEPGEIDGQGYIFAAVVVVVCLLFGAMLLQTVKSQDELTERTKKGKGKRTFKFHKNTTFTVEELE